MTSRDFVYWLQGFFELRVDGERGLNEGQVKAIEQHLSMVFLHEIDPSMGDEKHQEKLDEAHKPPKPPKPAHHSSHHGPSGGIVYRC